MTVSAALPVNIAIATALLADAGLTTALGTGKVYNFRAPQGTAKPYLTLGDTTESEFPTFQRGGNQGTETIHVWSAKVEKGQLLTLFGHVKRILDRTSLAVTGHVHVRGRVSLVATMDDPDGVSTHAVARYEVVTQVAA